MKQATAHIEVASAIVPDDRAQLVIFILQLLELVHNRVEFLISRPDVEVFFLHLEAAIELLLAETTILL